MIFSELYSAYYNGVAEIIKKTIKSPLTESEMRDIIKNHAFSESHLSIIPSLKSGKWQIMSPNMKTNIRHAPTMPLTTLQKRWLKSMSLDPRIRLFNVEFEGLDDVEPLFNERDYAVYDKYGDGDPYGDEKYIKRFQLILDAVKNERFLKIEMTSRHGNIVEMTVFPKGLEYSQKDDKFRLLTYGCRYIKTVNLSRIISCKVIDGWKFEKGSGEFTSKKELVTLKINDTRNALERCLMHFAHFEKTAKKIGENTYLLTVKYDVADETEMVIRVLSFGPHVEVIAPESFRGLIVQRLIKQRKLL